MKKDLLKNITYELDIKKELINSRWEHSEVVIKFKLHDVELLEITYKKTYWSLINRKIWRIAEINDLATKYIDDDLLTDLSWYSKKIMKKNRYEIA